MYLISNVSSLKVKREDLYLGNTLLLLSRRLQVVDYGDEVQSCLSTVYFRLTDFQVTRSLCSQSLETTVVILPSEALNEAGRFIQLSSYHNGPSRGMNWFEEKKQIFICRLLAEAQAAGFSLGRAKIISLNSVQVSGICSLQDDIKIMVATPLRFIHTFIYQLIFR